MKNTSIYIGFTLMSDEADGHKRVSTADGLSYHGLDDLQATMIEDVLVNEFGPQFDALKQQMRERLVELGYAGAVANGADSADVEKLKGMANKGKGNRPA